MADLTKKRDELDKDEKKEVINQEIEMAKRSWETAQNIWETAQKNSASAQLSLDTYRKVLNNLLEASLTPATGIFLPILYLFVALFTI